MFPYEHFNWANLLMEPEIDGVEKKPFLPFHPSCIVDSCQQPYPYCDSPFLSLTWVNGLNFHYGKHTGSKGIFVPLFSFMNHEFISLKVASQERDSSFYECSLPHPWSMFKKSFTKCKFDKIDIIQYVLYIIRVINCKY